MTIKDMEFRTGMSRANIRFYESEGLVSPKRNESGYRDYSEEDFEILMRIKLLRVLHISLEEIKAVHNKKEELQKVLEQNIKRLGIEKEQICKSQNVCVLMKNDHVKYETLNAEYYLNSLGTMNTESEKVYYNFAVDVMPKTTEPIRRFLARNLDIFIYSCVFNIVISMMNGTNILKIPVIVTTFFAFVMMIVIEPVLLSKFGTTMGKAILGIYITDENDGKMTYKDASDRTWKVFGKGMGYNFSVYSLYRLWKSYSALENCEDLEWEKSSIIVLRDKKRWRSLVYVGVIGVFFILGVISMEITSMPKNRGDITIAEFAENYNKMAIYYEAESVRTLNENGKWYDFDPNIVSNSYIMTVPQFEYVEENGIMTGMRFLVNTSNSKLMADGFQTEMKLAAISFIGAQESCGLFVNEIDEIVDKIEKSSFVNFEIEAHGVQISCKVDYEGYVHRDGMGVLMDEDTDNEFYLLFTMEKL